MGSFPWESRTWIKNSEYHCVRGMVHYAPVLWTLIQNMVKQQRTIPFLYTNIDKAGKTEKPSDRYKTNLLLSK